MSLTATDRDAQIMEISMCFGFSIIKERGGRGGGKSYYYVPDGISLTWDTLEQAWDAAIFCAQKGWHPYGEQALPVRGTEETIQDAVGPRHKPGGG